MRQGRPTRFFHGGSNLSPPSQHPTLHNDYPAHLSQACLEICKNIRAHEVFDELPDPQSRGLVTGKAIHAQGLKLGVSSKWLLGNAIVDVYSKSGDVSSARKAFDQLEKKDVFAWNSVLSMHSKRGSLDSVVDSFVSLRRCEALPNGFTLAMVLSASARLADPDLGRQIHCNVFKTGFHSDSYCQGAAMDMYAKCNMMNDACRAFDAAEKKTDLVSWTVMVTGHLRAGSPEQAIEAFERMKKHGLVPDQVAYASVISACVGLGKLDRAREFFMETVKQNVVAWNLMISGHAKADRASEALAFFAEMRKSGVKPTRSTLGSILSAVATLRALDFGSLVHAHGVKQGLDSNFYVGSSLINMYAKCERVGDSRRVFDGLDNKNVVLWNAMLGGYAQNRYSSEVMELFRGMIADGISPDEFTYTSIFSACSSFESLDLGQQLHGVVVKNKLSSNLFVGNALTDMYAKSGALSDARKQFDGMRNRDKVSWNAIIVGYVQEEDEAEAFSMFRRMILSWVLPDEVSVASIFSACANRKSIDNGRQVHCLSLKCGLETSLYAGSSLVDMYAKCDNIEAAHKVYTLMPTRGVVSANALIAGYSQIDLGEAVRLLHEMRALELSPTDITFASLLDACDESSMLGKQIHGMVSKAGLLCGDCDFLRVSLLGMYMNSRSETEAGILFSEFPNPKSRVVWTAMISGLAQNGQSEEALRVYRGMHKAGVLADQATFASALSACALSAALSDGRAVHALVFRTGLDLDEPTGSALVDMYAKCGAAESSSRVFREMKTKHDVVSWNSMIVGLAKNGHADEAIEVFEEMIRGARVRPDHVTFLGILTACSHAGRVEEGRRIFRSMAGPRVDHVACTVDLLGRWGFLDEAEELAQGTEFSSDAMVWAALLGSCRLHGDELRGRRAAHKLFALDPQSSSPYVLLSNMYATSGDWHKACSVRTRMREKGVAKLPGQSWIAVGRSTRVFLAGDDRKSPSEDVDEIRGVLKCLTRLMKHTGTSPADVDSFAEE